MKLYKKLMLFALSLINVIIYIVGIAYLIDGIKAPNVIGNREVQFMGSYLISIAYMLVAIILTIIIIMLVKFNKKRKCS